MAPKEKVNSSFSFHFLFYLHSVILGSGFPQHGVAGVLKPGRGAAAEGVNVTRWMEERSRG